MGTYTTNKELFMPTIGEQGWGELVNGNFETIDNFLKPITVSGSTYTFTGNHVGNQSGGSISATSISNSGTLTQTGTSTFTGMIYANGGINADLSPCFDVTSESDVVSSTYLLTSITLVYTTNTTVTKTYTYKGSPITNTVNFTLTASPWSGGNKSVTARCYLQINGTTVVDTGIVDSTVNETYSTTLNNGDKITCYAQALKYGGGDAPTASTIVMTSGGYIVNA